MHGRSLHYSRTSGTTYCRCCSSILPTPTTSASCYVRRWAVPPRPGSRAVEKVLRHFREIFHLPARRIQGLQAHHDRPVRDRAPPVAFSLTEIGCLMTLILPGGSYAYECGMLQTSWGTIFAVSWGRMQVGFMVAAARQIPVDNAVLREEFGEE